MQRAWCIWCRFEGKEPFCFGTIFAPEHAKMHELDALADAAFDRVFPLRPTVLDYVAGLLIFTPEANVETAGVLRSTAPGA